MAETSSKASPLAAIVAVVTGWVGGWLLWPLGLLLYLPALLWAAGGGRRAGGITLGLSPFVIIPLFSMGQAVNDWYGGVAHYRTCALPTAEVHNLDPTLRVPIARSNWPSNGREAFTRQPYNVMLRLLGQVGGPMQGGYTGPYPSSQTAWQMLEDAVEAGAGRYTWYGTVIDELAYPQWTLRAAKTGSTLIIGHSAQLWLVDSGTGVAFATYRRPREDTPWRGWETPQPTPPGRAPTVHAYPLY